MRPQLGPPEDGVAADASPDDVRLCRGLLLAVGERCSAVRGLCQLENPVVSPDGLHAQAAARWPAMLQIHDELSDSSKERFLRVAVERSEFPSEHALPFVGGHDGDRRRCERNSVRTAVAGPVGGGRLTQRSQELVPGGEHRAASARGAVLCDLLLAGLPLVGPVPPLVPVPLRTRTKENAVAGHLDIQLVALAKARLASEVLGNRHPAIGPQRHHTHDATH